MAWYSVWSFTDDGVILLRTHVELLDGRISLPYKPFSGNKMEDYTVGLLMINTTLFVATVVAMATIAGRTSSVRISGARPSNKL